MYKVVYKYENRLDTTKCHDRTDLFIICQAIKEMGGLIIQIQTITGDLFNVNLT